MVDWKSFCAEMLLQLRRHLLRQVGPLVEHGEDHALDHQPGIQVLADALHGVEQLAHTFECKVLGLHGNQDRIRRYKGIQGEQIERWRAVKDDELKAASYRVERIAQAEFPASSAYPTQPHRY